MHEAAELAENAGVPLTVLTVVTQEEFESDAEVLGTIAEFEGADYQQGPAEYAAEVAGSAVSDLLTEYNVETETIGRHVADDADRGDEIIKVAEENECDYIFLVGRRRSPTGKVIFGDTAQKVILNYDGYVVTLTD